MMAPVCYFCKKDYAKKGDAGGIIFSGLAICPRCETKILTSYRKFRLDKTRPDMVQMRARRGEEFRELVRRWERNNAGMGT